MCRGGLTHGMYATEVVLDLENVVGLLIASEMYELDALREMCKGFVLNHAHEVFRDPQIVQIPEKLLLEVPRQDSMHASDCQVSSPLHVCISVRSSSRTSCRSESWRSWRRSSCGEKRASRTVTRRRSASC